jgi:hypothetical protein
VSRPDIFGGGESQSTAIAARGPTTVRDTQPHDCETRRADTQIHGMCHTDSADSARGHQLGVQGESVCGNQGRLPKLNFPVFSGEDPQLWKYRCEKYFMMYGVEDLLWISVASMHLEGAAARWFQPVEQRLSATSWS